MELQKDAVSTLRKKVTDYTSYLPETSLRPADILLPRSGVDMRKWAVIACDQFTSQPEYWKRVEDYVQDAPSMLRLIYPEVYLNTDNKQAYEERIAVIQTAMKEYLEQNILTERVHQGYVLTVRRTSAGDRIGLVAALDLEKYDYHAGTDAPVRATEATVKERIPVRVGIREGASLESPHVMVLMDAPKEQLLEALYKERMSFEKLYDTELMEEGGHVAGYAVTGVRAKRVSARLQQMEASCKGIFLAVGDGNHSLASAKTCWENVKKNLTEKEWANHPMRYALVEVVNLYSPSLMFYPIHRVLYDCDDSTLADGFAEYLDKWNMRLTQSDDDNQADVTFLYKNSKTSYRIDNRSGHLPVELLQKYLDAYLKQHPKQVLDYVHSETAAEQIAEAGKGCTMILGTFDKSTLFDAIEAGGVLPRKTFSIGEDIQKRYYMECRKIIK